MMLNLSSSISPTFYKTLLLTVLLSRSPLSFVPVWRKTPYNPLRYVFDLMFTHLVSYRFVRNAHALFPLSRHPVNLLFRRV